MTAGIERGWIAVTGEVSLPLLVARGGAAGAGVCCYGWGSWR